MSVDSLWAAPSFPRGPGYYYSLYKLALLAAAFLAWVSACAWAQRDAEEVGLEPSFWNPVLLGAGVAGLLLFWAVPGFWVGLPLMLAVQWGAWFAYVQAHNRRAPAAKRMLTSVHFQRLMKRMTQLKFSRKAAATLDDGPGVPVRFIGRSMGEKHTDPKRIARASSSKGYRAALQMVYEAVERRATDIHLEPTREETAVRLRIDGIMQASQPFSRGMGDAVVNIFKVLCDLDITEKRKAQDGSFSAQVADRNVDFRVATAGSVGGEKLVMRILDQSRAIGSLTQLGMRDRVRDQVHALVTQPHGMFVVCGPTGAGKSTTLYACLNEIDRHTQNIITIENPVEYQLDSVTQIEVNLKAGKTFANELRSILRQDPDVIMVGEVRDKETAEIACQAAQTGHMVFTTLHANDTVTALGRLLDLGVQPFMVGSALTAVLGQRLVRVLCPKCKVAYRPNPELLRKANLPPEKIKSFYRPPTAEERAGEDGGGACPHCRGTGYHGRTGVFELLVLNDRLREMVRANPDLPAIKQEAFRSGMRLLYEDGMRLVVEGKTSIQELLRVST